MLQCGGRKLSADERCPFVTSNDIADHHAWAVGACRLNAPFLWPFPDKQAQSPLKSTAIRLDLLQAHHVLPQSVVVVGFSGDLGLHQENEVKFTNLYCPYGLGDPKPPSILDVVGHY